MTGRQSTQPGDPNIPGRGPTSSLPNDEGGLRAPPGLGPMGRFWWWCRFAIWAKTARLRFIAILVAVGGTIAYWDVLNAYYEKWTRPLYSAEAAVGSDTEFWCPMHPTIVRDKSDKCPICGMPLSKRKKGEASEDEPLPPGVISRVQISPYRIALAGIQTTVIDYQQLTKDINTVGFVEFDERSLARISVRLSGKSRIEKLEANVTGMRVRKGDALAVLYNPDLVVTVQNLLDARQNGNRELERIARERLHLWGIDDDQMQEIVRTGQPITRITLRSPISGYVIKKYQVEGEYVEEGARLYEVVDLSTVWIEAQIYEDEIGFMKEGLPVVATAKSFPGREFAGHVNFIYPHMDAGTRTLKVRCNIDNQLHELRPGMYANVRMHIPMSQLNLFTSDESADRERQDQLRQGRVLAVPERAVIDTGHRKVVYREAEPGIYEGVEIQVGSRAGGYYPVLSGLARGERVATAGSFLIDAETRLTAGLGSNYISGNRGSEAERRSAAARPSMTDDEEEKVKAAISRLNSEDRTLVDEQVYCPILSDSLLGSMGTPIKVLIRNQPVFLCCKGCATQAKANEDQTLAKLAQLKSRPKAQPKMDKFGSIKPRIDTDQDRMLIFAALSKLSSEDRRIAQEQLKCPESGQPLGSMGTPVKLVVKGQPVFICCKSCEDRALESPDVTLAKVAKFRTQESGKP